MTGRAPTHRSTCAWVRYGGTPIRDEEIRWAADRCTVAILQPWETAAAARLKRLRPDLVVLAYQCLSSTRSYEPGPVYSSGVSHAQSPDHWFARRPTGERVEWRGYPGHFQMAVWDEGYRAAWVRAVRDRFAGSPFDGVMADNDVYDDYYGVLPLADGRSMADVRAGLELLVEEAGAALADVGALLVPNIAESRREPGRWERHARWGGGFEEVFLSWGPGGFLGVDDVVAQAPSTRGPGLAVVRTAGDGRADDPMWGYAVAAFWVLGGGAGTGVTVTGHDGYDATPWSPLQEVDLGLPVGPVERHGEVLLRRFSRGLAVAAVGAGSVSLPPGLLLPDGAPAPATLELGAHTGTLLRRPGG